jgi:hypothetical protein
MKRRLLPCMPIGENFKMFDSDYRLFDSQSWDLIPNINLGNDVITKIVKFRK